MIYQDARASLNPRLKALDLIGEPLRQHALCPPSALRDQVAALLARVGMPADTADRYPSQLSGGQVRRVAIARALASEPKVIVADEAVSGLDVSTQAQLLNLLRGLQREMGLTLLFITHDLAVASYLCSRIAVMYLGRIVETGPTKEVLRRPLHPYTRALLNASPRFFAPIAETLAGEIPSPIDLPSRMPVRRPLCSGGRRLSRARAAARHDAAPGATSRASIRWPDADGTVSPRKAYRRPTTARSVAVGLRSRNHQARPCGQEGLPARRPGRRQDQHRPQGHCRQLRLASRPRCRPAPPRAATGCTAGSNNQIVLQATQLQTSATPATTSPMALPRFP